MQRVVTALLVLLAVGPAVAGVNPTPLLIGFVPFTVVHGVRRYGWRTVSVYAAITLVVSLSLENLSVATGFRSAITTTRCTARRTSQRRPG
jgi:hypothetical protein